MLAPGRSAKMLLAAGWLAAAFAARSRGDEGLESSRLGLSQRAAAVDNFSVHATYRERSRKRMVRGAPFVEHVKVVDATIELDQQAAPPAYRMTAELVASIDPDDPPMVDPKTGEKVFRYTVRGVTTPEESRSLHRAADGRMLIGEISPRPLVPLPVHPLYLLGLGDSSPLYELEDANRIESTTRRERLGTYEAVIIDWAYDNSAGPPGTAVKGSFWLAPSLGFATIRAEMNRRVGPNGPWRQVLLREASEFAQHAGLWLPGRVVYRRSNAYDDGGYELEAEIDVKFEDWRVNSDLPPGTFVLDFPDGTGVADQVRNVKFIKGRISDASIQRQVEQAIKLARDPSTKLVDPALERRFGEQERDAPSFAWPRWAWLTLIVGVLGCVAAIIIRKRTARPSGPGRR